MRGELTNRLAWSRSWVLRLAPFGAGALLFEVAGLINVRVESVQQGLLQVRYPYSPYSFLLTCVAAGLLIFGVALNLALIGKRMPPRPYLGSGCVALGLTVTPVSILALLADESAYQKNCLVVRCGPFLQNNLLEVIIMSIAVVIGLLSTGAGIFFLVYARRR
jgi:hypothetical protein